MEPEEYARIHHHEQRHFWYRGVHALFTGALARALPGGPLRLLDAGCGTGGLLESIGRRFPAARRFGFDLSPHALRFAPGRAAAPLLQASIERVPFRDGAFDAVVSADVLYHRAVADDAAALAELARVTRPGGVVLLNLPAHRDLYGAHDAFVHTQRRYERADVERIAAAAGLAVERLCWFNSALFPLARARRRRTRAAAAASDVALPLAPVNALLSAWLRFEAWWTLRAPLPTGLSLFAILRRPGPPVAPAR
ncbi:MAG: class I SAM-dependent methyltransferase [Planctomycetes bacterium]|nr:class I SAM-dependent methyltransferase [Planctomycetota bacterium]